MEGIDILRSKDETQTFYLKDDLEDFILGYPDIFDSYLKNFFLKILRLKKKRILITSYFQQKLEHRLKSLSVFCKSMVDCITF